MHEGEVLTIGIAGGGGHGSPTERDRQRVLEDVLSEKVTVEAARRVYGVDIDLAGRCISESVTRLLRP
jgi:N-methylhydantoinase B